MLTAAIGALRRQSEQHGWNECDLFLRLATPTGRLDKVRPLDVLGSESANVRVTAAELEMSAE